MNGKKSGEWKVTIRDVAERAGVVPSTVSNVLNRTAPTSDETRRKVLAAIEELGYIPDASAKALRRKRTGLVGVVLQDMSSEFYAKCTASMLRAAGKDNYVLLVVDSAFDHETMRKAVQELIQRRVEGLAFIGGGRDQDILDECVSAGVPIVLGDRHVKGFSSVEFNNEETMTRLVRMCYAAGYRRFAYAGEPIEIQSNLIDRYNGFRKGLDSCLVPEADRVVILDEALHMSKVADSFRFFREHLLDDAGRPVADIVLTSNDLIAHGFVASALHSGLRVPEDIAVAGFDDIAFSGLMMPTLTSVSQGEEELGRSCYELLKTMIQGSRKEQHVMLRQFIRSRESTRIPENIFLSYEQGPDIV